MTLATQQKTCIFLQKMARRKCKTWSLLTLKANNTCQITSSVFSYVTWLMCVKINFRLQTCVVQDIHFGAFSNPAGFLEPPQAAQSLIHTWTQPNTQTWLGLCDWAVLVLFSLMYRCIRVWVLVKTSMEAALMPKLKHCLHLAVL